MMYIISTDPNSPAVSSFMDPYYDLGQAQRDAQDYAKHDKQGATYYVYEVSMKPVFKAAAAITVTAEVIS